MIYLDNAATTKVDSEILESYNELLKTMYMNTSSIHQGGQQSARLLQKARDQIASLFGVLSNEVIFTSGSTESNNMAIKGVAFKYQNRGKHLITSAVEHPSVLNTFIQLRDYFGFELTILPVDSNGYVSPDTLKEAMRDDTILVSIMAVNNEVGTINDIETLADIVHEYPKAIFHSDTTQAIGKIDIPYNKIDMFVLSAHKLHGLKGSGALIKKKNIELLPLLNGGGQEFGFRSGTNDFPKEVILAKTIRLALEQRKNHYDYVTSLWNYAYEKFETLKEDVVINSTKGNSPFVLNVSLINKKSSVIVEALSNMGIMVSTTSACSSKKEPHSLVLEAMGKDKNIYSNMIRLSFDHSNTKEDIDKFFEAFIPLLKGLKNNRKD